MKSATRFTPEILRDRIVRLKSKLREAEAELREAEAIQRDRERLEQRGRQEGDARV